MKANEAPEKLYFTLNEKGTHYYTEGIPFEREYIEYTRTDAFIEKAKEFISEHTYGSDYHVNYVLKAFENYMKGENE